MGISLGLGNLLGVAKAPAGAATSSAPVAESGSAPYGLVANASLGGSTAISGEALSFASLLSGVTQGLAQDTSSAASATTLTAPPVEVQSTENTVTVELTANTPAKTAATEGMVRVATEDNPRQATETPLPTATDTADLLSTKTPQTLPVSTAGKGPDREKAQTEESDEVPTVLTWLDAQMGWTPPKGLEPTGQAVQPTQGGNAQAAGPLKTADALPQTDAPSTAPTESADFAASSLVAQAIAAKSDHETTPKGEAAPPQPDISNLSLSSLSHTQTINTAAPHAAPTNAGQTSPQISAHVQESAQWNQQLGEKVIWQSKQGIDRAEIHLNPSHLGPLQISLSVSSEQTSASFVSQHAEVRQAIQDAMPQLKEMLANAGISLGQTHVGSQSQQSFSSPQQTPTPARNENKADILQDLTVGTNSTTPSKQSTRGMVDLFA